MSGRKELLILNPGEVATEGRTEIDLHFDATLVRESGPDWGQFDPEMFMADREFGSIPVDDRLPNRVITIPLLLGATGDFDAARIALQAEVARIKEEGGWLKRELIGGTYGEAGSRLFADIVKASLKLGGGTDQASQGVDPDAELILEVLPDWYGDEEVGELHEGTGDLSWVGQVNGNLPARVTSLTVEDASGNAQLGLAWHFRSRNYDAAETADWVYEAESMTPLDAAAEMELSGASGGKAIAHSNLSTSWTPVLSTNLRSGSFLTHKGLYNVWARVYTTNAEEPLPWLRLLWDVGDMVSPVENVQVQIPLSASFCLINLGQVNLQAVPFGEQRWGGTIQARGEQEGQNVHIDKLWLFCGDEASGVLSAPLCPSQGLHPYLARDGFNQSEAALNGLALPDGSGKWKTEGSAGGDFETTGEGTVIRKVGNDTTYRLAVPPGASIPAVVMQVSWEWSGVPAAIKHNKALYSGLIFGTTGLGEMIARSEFQPSLGAPIEPAKLILCGEQMDYEWIPGTRYTFTMVIGGGSAAGWVTTAGQFPTGRPTIVSGKAVTGEKQPAIIDHFDNEETITRTYDEFSMWVPSLDAVIYANKDARLSTNGMYRKSEDGEGYGPIAYPGSDLPRLPASGRDERPVEIALKVSRGDMESLPDSGLDKIVAQLSHRPCFSYVPSG